MHVITSPDGPVTPVGVEQAVEAAAGGRARPPWSASVRPGPRRWWPSSSRRPGRLGPLADAALAAAVRAAAAPVPLAAVLTVRRLPTDIRHNSKIDRAAVARWAGRVLAGERPGRL